MSIALFGISSFYNGIQKFMSAAAHLEPRKHYLGARPISLAASPKTSMLAKQRALRVLRITEHGEAPHCAGRMVISGRMADVCAELDRLVALEAQIPTKLPH